MDTLDLKLSGHKIKVCLVNDYYGENFWKKVQSNEYEPDTLGFVSKNSNPEVDFMDIGAANGAMTILAALQGARVKSYEPDPTIFGVLEQNILQNSILKELVHLDPSAISD